MLESEKQLAGFSENGRRGKSRRPKPDQHQMTNLVEKCWKGKIAFIQGSWRSHGAYWEQRDDSEVYNAIRQLLSKHYGGEIAISNGLINGVYTMAQHALTIPSRKIHEADEKQAPYVNLQNGLYNLETHQMEAHRPDLYFTHQLPFAYAPDADCPVLRRFLNTSLVDDTGKTDRQMIALAQEMVGYCMTARTDMKASLWLHGESDSGKSKFVGVFRSLNGPLHTTLDLNQLGSNRFMLSALVGKRVATFTEASVGIMLPDAIYKALVGGGDEIWTDVKNKAAISFVPRAKFVWAMNDAPRTSDRSGAVVNRLRIIRFPRSIPKNQQISDLDAQLARELPGIFNWAMDGYKRLVRAGAFTEPDQSKRWLEKYREENYTEGVYAKARWIRGEDFSMSTQELYADYKNWCEMFGYKPKNMTQVASEWRRLGLQDWPHNGYTHWRGAKLKGAREQFA